MRERKAFFKNYFLYLHGKDANGPLPGAMYWYKINSKYLIGLTIISKYMYLLEENISGNYNLGFGNGFLVMPPKLQATTTKLQTTRFHQIKKLGLS